MTRLQHLAEPVVVCDVRGSRPFVALEHLESRAGGLVGGLDLPGREPDATSMVSFKPGDVLFGKLRPYLAKSWRADREGLCSSELIVMRPKKDADSRWLGYLAQSDLFVDWAVATSEGVKMPRTSWEKLRLLDVPRSSLASQRERADYLDAETARIDALVLARRRQMSLVDARLASEIERRVLGRLGTPAQGVQASANFGSRPAGWGETTVRYLGVEVQTGPFGSQLHAHEYVDHGTPVINPMHLVGGRITPNVSTTVGDDKRRELDRHVLRRGDLVVARRGELGRVALVDEGSDGYLCGTGCLRLRLRGPAIRPEYLAMLMSSAPLRAYFETASVGSTMDNVSAETVLAAPVLVPPLEDQLEVERAVELSSDRAKRTRSAMARQISLLLERRQAVITAVVTDDTDFPGVAA